MAEGRTSRSALIVMTVLAAPVALGFETVLRALLLPPEFEELRDLLEPTLTPVAWVLAVLAGLAGVAGVAFQGRLAHRAVARLPEGRRTAETVGNARLGAFLLAASIPQIPAVLATLTYLFGASLVPVLVGIGLSTLAVFVQGALT